MSDQFSGAISSIYGVPVVIDVDAIDGEVRLIPSTPPQRIFEQVEAVNPPRAIFAAPDTVAAMRVWFPDEDVQRSEHVPPGSMIVFRNITPKAFLDSLKMTPPAVPDPEGFRERFIARNPWADLKSLNASGGDRRSGLFGGVDA